MAHRGSPRQRYLSNIQLSLDHCEWPTVWSKASLVIIKEEEMWDKSLVLSAFEALKSSKLISSSSSIYLRHAKERSILRVRNRNGLFFEMGIKSSSKQASISVFFFSHLTSPLLLPSPYIMPPYVQEFESQVRC